MFWIFFSDFVFYNLKKEISCSNYKQKDTQSSIMFFFHHLTIHSHINQFALGLAKLGKGFLHHGHPPGTATYNKITKTIPQHKPQ